MIDSTETLGNLVTEHPAITPVLLRYHLDFCCGGAQRLEDACRDAGVDPEAVIAEIDELDGGSKGEPQRWDSRPVTELIDHIIRRYHEPLKRDLPGLVEAARRVENRHADKPTCPHGLSAHLERMHMAVLSHLQKEEQVLFPALRIGHRGSAVHMPIRVMLEEHDDHGASLRYIRELTSDLEPPPEACSTWRALYSALEKLERELMEHIHLENNVLFPRVLND